MLLNVILPCVVYGLLALMAVFVLLDFRATKRQTLAQVELAKKIHAQQARVLAAVESLKATPYPLPLWILANLAQLTVELKDLIQLGRMKHGRLVPSYVASTTRIKDLNRKVQQIERAKETLIKDAEWMLDPMAGQLELAGFVRPIGCGVEAFKNYADDQLKLDWFIKRYAAKPGQGALAWHWRYMFG